MEKLKPCPFCGSTDTDVLRSTDGVKFWGRCETCGAVGGVGSTDEEAVNNWNRRGTTKQDDRALLPCPKCGYPHLLIHHWEPRHEDEAESYQVECPACGFVALPANDEDGAIELWNRMNGSEDNA